MTRAPGLFALVFPYLCNFLCSSCSLIAQSTFVNFSHSYILRYETLNSVFIEMAHIFMLSYCVFDLIYLAFCSPLEAHIFSVSLTEQCLNVNNDAILKYVCTR